MYCENCGHKLDSAHRFCTKCGVSVSFGKDTRVVVSSTLDDKWWYRLLKVGYILLYVPMPVFLWIIWEINATTWSYYGGYQDNSGQAFWYCLITLFFYLVLVRLVKIACLYVAFGKSPKWRQECIKLF